MRHLLFALVCLLWGSNFILMKKAMAAFGPISIGAWRVALGAMVLVAVWLARRRRGHRDHRGHRGWPIEQRHLPHLLLVVMVSYIYPFTIQPYLIGRYQDSAFIGMMVSLVPLLTIMASIVLLRIWPTPRQMLGVLGGLVCFALVFYDGRTTRQMSVFHLACAGAVPLAYAIGNTYLKKHLSDVPSTALTLAAMLLASAALLPVGLTRETVRWEHELFADALAALLFFGTVGTGLATVMFYKLIQDHGPLYAGMVTYLIPVVALLWGVWDGEPLTGVQLGALAGILAMVALVQSDPHGVRRAPRGR